MTHPDSDGLELRDRCLHAKFGISRVERRTRRVELRFENAARARSSRRIQEV